MATAAKKAIMKAKIENVLYEIMVKTNAENVLVDDTTTLAAKLAEILAALDTKATPQNVTDAVAALKQEILGDVPVEAYDTFTELAKYIEEHQDAANALTEAIGNKASQESVDAITQTLNELGALAKKDTVGEDDLDAALKEKVNAASEGNHAHLNKELLDTYDQTNENIKDAVDKRHEHPNKEVLDGITAENVAGWNGKANVYYSAEEPANLAEGDLWVQLVE